MYILKNGIFLFSYFKIILNSKRLWEKKKDILFCINFAQFKKKTFIIETKA